MSARFVLNSSALLLLLSVISGVMVPNLAHSKEVRPVQYPLDIARLEDNPFAKQIRHSLREYLLKEPSQVSPIIIDADLYRDYYLSKFKVLDIRPAHFGGNVLEIIFVDKPDRVFWVWVYELGADAGYQMRAITDRRYGEEFMASIRKTYEEYLADSKHSF